MEMEEIEIEQENEAHQKGDGGRKKEDSLRMSNNENWLKVWMDSEDDEDKEKKGDIQDHPTIKDKIYECKTFAGYTIKEAYEGDKIKQGQRVVLSPDYAKKDIDCKGKDCVGTVVKAENDEVHVLWDLEDKPKLYKVQEKMGGNVTNTLLLLDNAQTGAKHDIDKCDECEECPIRGIKWRCLLCKDCDLCTRCYMLDKHNISHPFHRKLDNYSRSVEVGVRSMDFKENNYKSVDGIFKGAKVALRRDSSKIGKVKELNDEQSSLFNCDALVKWEDGKSEERFRVGREGRVDLKCVTPGKGLKYYEEHLQIVTNENAKPGMRVVEKYREGKKEQYVGTVISIEDTLQDITDEDSNQTRNRGRNFRWSEIDSGQKMPEKDSKLTVQWDNKKNEEIISKNKTILLYDSSQIGVDHRILCDECGRKIRGVRWKCENKDYDLCSDCYMSDKGEMGMIFYRMVDPSESERLDQPRSALASKNKVQALGLFKGANVSEIGSSNGRKRGKISKITNYKVNAGRNVVTVVWDKDSSFARNGWKITDLKCLKFLPTFTYYPAHLPKLQDDMHGYIKAGDGKTKIFVDLWFDDGGDVKLRKEKVIPYLLFANNPDTESERDQKESKNERMDSRSKLLGNIRSISKKTGLPCLDIVEKTLFFQDKVIIHQKTTKDTIHILIKMGEYAFERGDCKEEETEIKYFQRMIEAHCRHKVLPFVISIGNGGFKEEILISAVKSYPIVSFKAVLKWQFYFTLLKKSSKDASVFLIDDYKKGLKMPLLVKEYLFDVKIPWRVKKEFEARLFYNTHTKLKDDEFEISSTDDIQYDLRNFDALICCMVIAVFMAGRTPKDLKDKYPNPLSMYLLKSGKWRIPRDVIKDYFDYKSIEYIMEKRGTVFKFCITNFSPNRKGFDHMRDMESEFKVGLWKELQESTKKAYLPPAWKNSKLKVSISGLFGLIFLALLKGKFYTGAKQFVETGCVRIHFILVGCVILQEAATDWRTNQVDKEKCQIMIKKFTHQALRIISCIYDGDKQKRSKLQKEETIIIENEEKDKKEVDADIQHSGRLLLNHNYLRDGIRTKNKVFADNEVVKNILNQMWYGVEKLTVLRVGRFILLTIFHFILLPLLMITMEHGPLKWLYKQYKFPVMKVWLNMLSLFALLTGYGYMLLFDFGKEVSNTDTFLIAWMISFFIDEIKQIFVAVKRRRTRQYFTDFWNYLDWISMITYTSGMLTKLGEGTCYLNASKVLLVIGFITVSIRILHMFSMSKLLGPKLVIIRKMFLDTFALMTIMFIITMCYNTSYHALLYSENSDFTFEQFEKITRNGYWMLFGELNLDDAKLTEPDCSFNQTEYREGSKERCPSSLGKAVAPYLKAVYVLIAVILLLNLLIAMYSHSFSKVHEKSKFYWSQLQTDFLEDFSIRSIFPVHMQLLAIPFFFIHACAWAVVSIPRYGTVKCCSSDDDDNDVGDDKDDISKLRHAPYSPDDDIKKLNKVPMFVRVFIYDSNYDLKLRKTRKTEGQAALSTKGEMDISEENKITEMSRKLIRHQKKIQKRINENIQKQIQMKLRPESIQKSNIEDNLGTSLSRRQRHPAIKIKQSLSYEYDSDSDVENESDT